MKVIMIIAAVIAAIILLLWVGLNIQPAPSDFPEKTSALDTIPLPGGLPAPVERFYRKLYGDQVPVISSTVITGRARVRPAGPVSLPARFRFTHEVGKNCRHYIEATLFGLPVMTVNESYLDDKARAELPYRRPAAECRYCRIYSRQKAVTRQAAPAVVQMRGG